MDDLRVFFSDALIGTFDEFIKSYPKFGWDNLSVLDDWNAQQIRPLLNLYHKQNGIELACDRRIFVVAPNPKSNGYPVRITHYYENSGALCDVEVDSVVQALIDCLISYPELQPSYGKLDTWMENDKFSNSFH
ncbi:hypothetical protein EIV04_13130 [Salmonella enterica]|nr:hypothetical protein [Salmonella enterica]EBR7266325.1 hypothetical protein [Salmonella enterica]EKK5263087.1 hypothetical protein [Cronobacter sakazakii]